MVGCLFVAVLFVGATCECVVTPLREYAGFVTESLKSDKYDRRTMRSWFRDFQVQQVNVTTSYRLDMMRHRDQSFQWTDQNTKWQECEELHKSDIANSENTYYTAEAECVSATSADEGRKRHAVYQVEKEIKKWRKSYRYLLNRCRVDNPGDDVATGECLADYMKRDNYHGVFQRLTKLKAETMLGLFRQMGSALGRLEECLASALSEYLSGVRTITSNINQCYSLRNKGS